MSADLTIYLPGPGLDPESEDFIEEIERYCAGPPPPASPRLLAFLRDLRALYPDRGEDTVWALTPIDTGLHGNLLGVGLRWSCYGPVHPALLALAHRHGLSVFDPQSETHHPPSEAAA